MDAYQLKPQRSWICALRWSYAGYPDIAMYLWAKKHQKATELDWRYFNAIKRRLTPSHHFSGAPGLSQQRTMGSCHQYQLQRHLHQPSSRPQQSPNCLARLRSAAASEVILGPGGPKGKTRGAWTMGWDRNAEKRNIATRPAVFSRKPIGFLESGWVFKIPSPALDLCVGGLWSLWSQGIRFSSVDTVPDHVRWRCLPMLDDVGEKSNHALTSYPLVN